jgi:hypothetical protein
MLVITSPVLSGDCQLGHRPTVDPVNRARPIIDDRDSEVFQQRIRARLIEAADAMRRTPTFDRCRRIVNGLHEYKTGSLLAPGAIAIGLDSVSYRVLANGEFHQYNWYVPSLNSLNILFLPVALQPRTDDDRPSRKGVQFFRSDRDAALGSRNCHRRCNFEGDRRFRDGVQHGV